MNISSSHNESIQDYDHQMESDNDEISDEKELKRIQPEAVDYGRYSGISGTRLYGWSLQQEQSDEPQKSASGDPVQVMKTMHKNRQ